MLNWKVSSEFSLFWTDFLNFYRCSLLWVPWLFFCLSLHVMDRCKSSLSCSDSPISPNLICLKNTAFTLLSSPHLSSPLLSYISLSPLFHFSPPHHSYRAHLNFCLFPSSSPPLSLPPSCVTFESLSYLLEWKSSFTICLIKCVFNPMGDILFFFKTLFFIYYTSAQFHLIQHLAQVFICLSMRESVCKGAVCLTVHQCSNVYVCVCVWMHVCLPPWQVTVSVLKGCTSNAQQWHC